MRNTPLKGLLPQKGTKKHEDRRLKQNKQTVDPDAPGTPGEPGYEPPVRREDLDEEGKKLWDSKNKK